MCKSKKLDIILAGRNKESLQKQSEETGYPFEVVEVSDTPALKNLLSKGALVIHCGGPFQFTVKPMIDACLQTSTHYTDITGEHQVFEMLAGYDQKGKEAGIMIMPGTGFDVVPSDCLALHLKNRLPSATHLQLAFTMSKGGLSRGTARTTIEGLGGGSLIRKNGELISIPLGEKVLEVDFGSFKTKTLNIPWGDISTAWRSTGIPNIEVYMGATDKMIRNARMSKYFNWLLRSRWMKDYARRKIDSKPPGPSDKKRKSGRSFLWGKVWDDAGNECISRIETVNGYTLTALTSVLIAEKIMQINSKTGYWTPSAAFGADLVLEVDNTTRVDI